mgnify:CR=1 FL=1|jgi:hypothetical protein
MKTILCDIIQSRSPQTSKDETPPCEDETEEVTENP